MHGSDRLRLSLPGFALQLAVNATGVTALVACTTDLAIAENFADPQAGAGASENTDSAVLPDPSSGSDVTHVADASSLSDAASACVPVVCRGRARARACGNCEDDDQDGLADVADPDCWGACDDDETQLSSAAVCPNNACFFDPDCGAGNDEQCSENTLAGCDCHGCCAVPGESYAVQLGRVPGSMNVCTSESLANEAACPRCEVDAACAKACVACEPCFGVALSASCPN